MSIAISIRDLILGGAQRIIGIRETEYGSPEECFERIAKYWRAHLRNQYGYDIPLHPRSVGLMMALLKIARIEESPHHGDSYRDACGYLALAGEIARAGGLEDESTSGTDSGA